MALIICPECKKEISDTESSCPNCGCPIYKDDERKKDWIEITQPEQIQIRRYRRKNFKKYSTYFLIILAIDLIQFLCLIALSYPINFLLFLIIGWSSLLYTPFIEKTWYMNHRDELYKDNIIKND